MSARADLCGGRSAMIVPTATSQGATEIHDRFLCTLPCLKSRRANKNLQGGTNFGPNHRI
jgi:hypothetical protein